MMKRNSKKISDQLMVQYLSGECSNQERLFIEDRMNSDPEFNAMMDAWQKLWEAQRKEMDIEDVDLKWQRMQLRIEKERKWAYQYKQAKPRRALTGFLSVPNFKMGFALTCLLLLASAFWMAGKGDWKTWLLQPNPIEYETVQVEHGKRIRLTLSDGTKIVLDSGSQLKYPAEFSERRDVFLEGEAYFEVAHDKTRPFYVHSGQALVQVLGTKFNVRSWNESPAVSVTVSQGRVSLCREDIGDDGKVYLERGQQSKLAQYGKPTQPAEVDVDEYTGWMQNEIHFKNAPLKELIAQLERWYDYAFVVDDSIIANQVITVHLECANVNEVIEMISILTGTVVRQSGKQIYFLDGDKDLVSRQGQHK